MSIESLVNLSRLNSNNFTIDESLLNSNYFKVDKETMDKYKSIDKDLKDIFDLFDNQSATIEKDDDDNDDDKIDNLLKLDDKLIFNKILEISKKLKDYKNLNYDLLLQINIDKKRLENI